MEVSFRHVFFRDLYFRTGNRRIDYVIAYNNKKVTTRRYFKSSMENFVNEIKKLHIEYEISSYSKDNNVKFLKIHVPHEVLEEFADLHNIELSYKSKSPRLRKIIPWLPCIYTDLSLAGPDSELYKRAKESVSMEKPKRLTQAERILLTNIILTEISFGETIKQQGIDRLVSCGAALAAYPLHEGRTTWTFDGPLTDRQLLFRYWCRIKNVFKIQPLNLIEKYFGPEMAFFYAFLQLTAWMLVIASTMGISFFIIGVIVDSKAAKLVTDYICNSDKILCPTCDPLHCHVKKLSSACGLTNTIHHYFDNAEMFILGICITLWGTIFLELWKKKQSLYEVEWNLMFLETKMEIRIGYEKRANLLKVSPFTKELEPTMTSIDIGFRVITSILGVLILILMVLGSEVLVVMTKMQIRILIFANIKMSLILENESMIVDILASCATVLVIMMIDLFYEDIARFLTDWENPRSQKEYDNSYLLKSFCFAFANNYTMVIYLAFFKGRFYTNPGDEKMYQIKGAYTAEVCSVMGCNTDLAIQVMFILGFKHIFIKCIMKFFMKVFIVFWRKFILRQKLGQTTNFQWEDDYILKPFGRYDIMKQYTEIIMRHGFVLFFSSVCPFTPFLALIVNLLEMKLYAFAYTSLYRRPIPRKTQGIEIWYYILQSLTWVGVIVNALLAVKTKEFTSRTYFLYSEEYNITKYMETKFAAFSMKDYKRPYLDSDKYEICYFFGRRYPPDHPKEYEETTEVYNYRAMGWILVVAYLHIVFILTRLIAFFIPKHSSEVKDYLNRLHAEDQHEIRKFRRVSYKSTSRLIIPTLKDKSRKDL